MIDGNIIRDKSLDAKGVSDWYRHDSELSDIEKWIVEKTDFSEEELRNVPRAEPTNGALALIFKNREDPYVISIIRGMTCSQLGYFKKFTPNSVGQGVLNEINQRWMNDERYLEHLDSDVDFIMYENGRNMRLFSEARAYFVISEREREEYFEK